MSRYKEPNVVEISSLALACKAIYPCRGICLEGIKMHPKIATLGTNIKSREKINEVYEWFVERIKEYGGSYRTPVLSEISGFLGISDNTLGKHLRWLVGMGLLVVSNPDNKKWRYARYSLPEDVEPKSDSVIEFKVDELVEEPRPEQQDEQVEEVSEVGLVPYIEGHSQLILNERRILDFDLAPIYGVSTGDLNRAYKRNLDMFEDDWVIQLDNETWERLCQNGITLDERQRFRPEPPLVYNAEGANSVAFQLKQSPIARKRAKTIIKVFSDLERMAHDEEPKQSGFAELMQMIVEQNKMVTANIVQLTTGVSSITTELDTRKADKKAVDEVKQTAEEAQRQAEEARQKAAEVGIKFEDITAKVDNLVNQDVINNRQMLIDQYKHIVTWLKYWEMGYDYAKDKGKFGDISSSICWQIKHDYGLPDNIPVTKIPSNLQERVLQDLRKSVFGRLEKRQPKDFYKLEERYRRFLISQGFQVLSVSTK